MLEPASTPFACTLLGRMLDFAAAALKHVRSLGPQFLAAAMAAHTHEEKVIMRWVLEQTPRSTDTQTTKELRLKLRSKLDQLVGYRKPQAAVAKGKAAPRVKGKAAPEPQGKHTARPAAALHRAVGTLASAGVLELEEDTKPRKGHVVTRFRKRTWAQVTSTPAAFELFASLECKPNLLPE